MDQGTKGPRDDGLLEHALALAAPSAKSAVKVPSVSAAGGRGYKRTSSIRVDSCSSVVVPSRSDSEANLNDASVAVESRR